MLSENAKRLAIAAADRDIKKEIYDSCQSLEYEMNSVFSTGGQTPFVTFNFGLTTSRWGREIQKNILQVRIDGLGAEKRTAVFPKLVFALKDGLNLKEGDPNYDIKELALECSSKRIYPDILSYDKIVEIYGYFISPMGCVRGYETLNYSDSNGPHISSIENMWNNLADKFEVKLQNNGRDEYIDVEGITVTDSHTGKNLNTNVKRLVKNFDSKWVKVVTRDHGTKNSRVLYCTTDHPLPVKGKGRVYAEDLEIGDVLNRSVSVSEFEKDYYESEDLAWLAGIILADGCLHENSEIVISYAYTGEDEIRDRIVSIVGEDRIREQEHHRGVKGTYREIVVKDKALRNRLIKDFEGMKKIDRTIPAELLSSSRNNRIAFLGGLIDADGYIHEKTGNVSLGSTNKTLAYAQLMLVESLGYKGSIRINYYKGKGYPDNTRYVVEFDATDENVSEVVCAKKTDKYETFIKAKPKYKTVNNDNTEITVYSVEPVTLNEPSYDLTTESDYFDISGIVSHNCRSFLPKHINSDGEEMSYGRRNIGVCSLNLPNIALSSENREEFFETLDERIQLTLKALMYRYDSLATVQARNAPILYSNGATGHRLEDNSPVQQMFRDGEATASVGYIGLHEVALRFFGEDWQDNAEAKQFTIDILNRMNYWTEIWKEETGIGFSLYSTPAESLTDRFARNDLKVFGSVEGITDKGWYTNSFHLVPTKKVDPFTKIDFEAVYPPLATGGHICYVETPTLQGNLKALEAIWDYMYDHVPYGGVNQPISLCYECKYSGDMDADAKGFFCPNCKNRNGKTLEIVQRMCGYLSTVSERKPISGRVKEIKSRVKHE